MGSITIYADLGGNTDQILLSPNVQNTLNTYSTKLDSFLKEGDIVKCCV